MTILDHILQCKREELAYRKEVCPLVELQARVGDAPPPQPFAEVLRRDLSRPEEVRLIAEVKRASPSKGPIRPEAEPLQVAKEYKAGGAHALSVLTEENFFLGKPEFLTQIRREVSLPVLRKDFILDPWQVWESRVLGADAILLITTCLSAGLLQDLWHLAWELGMEALVEIHSLEDLDQLPPNIRLVGINNRDLRTFHTSLEVTERLAPKVRESNPDRVIVSESGIFTRSDMLRVAQAGADAVLVGEAIMREGNIPLKVRELLGTF